MIVTGFTGGTGGIDDKANALTEPMLRDLTAAFDALAARGDLRAVILTGRGRVFSAGASLADARNGLAVSPEWERLSARVALDALPDHCGAEWKRCGGQLAGHGAGLRSADFRARGQFLLSCHALRLGFLPRPAIPRLVALVFRPSRARMILMAGQKIPATEERWQGLVDRLVPNRCQTPPRRWLATRLAPAAIIFGRSSR